MPKEPRPLFIAKFHLPKRHVKKYLAHYPFAQDEHVLYLGEIGNMPGHCVVAKGDGKVLWGYHTDNFVEVPDDET